MKTPYVFDEFFASGREESISPFFTQQGRRWGKNLALKSALLSALLLACAFALSFVNSAASNLLLIAVYFLVGTPALIDAIEDVRNLEINIDVLMTLAALLSVLIGSALEGALLLVLFELSASMENMVMLKTKSAVLSLQRMTPKTALVVADGLIHERATSDIAIGELILVQAGELVPLDGTVVSGSSELNLVHLTGESQPQPKHPGDEVPAGARNMQGALTIKVTRISSDSTLNRIVHLITQAQSAKPKVERFLDRFGKWYAPIIILLALAFAFILPTLLSIPYLGKEGGVYRALAFLIAASPCALIIATPTAYLSALSSCAKRGILLKGGSILDAIAGCSIVALDKTGTLTTGTLTCSQVAPLFKTTYSPAHALSIAASLERQAVHPIGDAIVRFAQAQKAPLCPIEDFKAVPGFGLQGTALIDGQKMSAFIGHPDYIEEKLPPHLLKSFTAWRAEATYKDQLSAILLIDDVLFLFTFEDEIRPESAPLISALISQHYDIVLLTGDHSLHAQRVGSALGIEKIYSNLRPEDKLNKVSELAEERGLIMVGDGVNDAPALARASVGISMGKIGSATAVDASDVVFLHDDLSSLPWLLSHAKKTMRILRENLTLALGVILFATTPALLGLVPLWAAVLLHEGGTVLVGLSSLRLLRMGKTTRQI